MTSDPISELMQVLEPLAWVDVTPTMTTRWNPRWPSRWAEVRCLVKPDEETLGLKKDREVRQRLYLLAEEVIAAVERSGWDHLRVPIIELHGDLMIGKKPRIIHECEVHLEIFPGRNV